MSWFENHEASERLASAAQTAQRDGRRKEARELYALAGDAERQAVEALDATKTRTIGISSVSAVSLYYKAARFDHAEETAYRWLQVGSLPDFAREQLRSLLRAIWSEQTRSNAPAESTPNEVPVSVQGGEVVEIGGAGEGGGVAPIGSCGAELHTIVSERPGNGATRISPLGGRGPAGRRAA